MALFTFFIHSLACLTTVALTLLLTWEEGPTLNAVFKNPNPLSCILHL